jgi:hypothetical protein
MKRLLLALGVFVLSAVMAPPSVPGAGQEEWVLINRDEGGNLLYVDGGSMVRLPDDIVKVRMKFLTAGEAPPMLFLDEVDCARDMIRRLEVSIFDPKGSGQGEPAYRLSFEGRWDKVSEGLEEILRDYVCGKN